MDSKITIDIINNINILYLEGLFTGSQDGSDELSLTLGQLIGRREKKIALNFEKVKLFTSQAIGSIVKSHNELITYDGRIIVFNLPKFIKSGFEIIKLNAIIPIFDNFEEVQAFFDKSLKSND